MYIQHLQRIIQVYTALYMYIQHLQRIIHEYTAFTTDYTCIYSIYNGLYMYIQHLRITSIYMDKLYYYLTRFKVSEQVQCHFSAIYIYNYTTVTSSSAVILQTVKVPNTPK